MAQQTAVEWLFSELQIRLLKIKSEPNGIVRERIINSFLIDAEQAEAIEKKQIKEAYWNGTQQRIRFFRWLKIILMNTIKNSYDTRR